GWTALLIPIARWRCARPRSPAWVSHFCRKNTLPTTLPRGLLCAFFRNTRSSAQSPLCTRDRRISLRRCGFWFHSWCNGSTTSAHAIMRDRELLDKHYQPAASPSGLSARHLVATNRRPVTPSDFVLTIQRSGGTTISGSRRVARKCSGKLCGIIPVSVAPPG